MGKLFPTSKGKGVSVGSRHSGRERLPLARSDGHRSKLTGLLVVNEYQDLGVPVKFRRDLGTLLFGMCTLLAGSQISQAQAVYGSILGTITDGTGAVVTGARITVVDILKGTSESTTSNASGNFSVGHLIPDQYDIKIEAKGFKTMAVKGVQVSADTNARIDEQLEVGGENQTVEVVDLAPQLKSDKADVSDIIDQKSIAEMPIPSRNFTQMEMLVPGTTFMSGGQTSSMEDPQGGVSVFFNGLRFGGVSYQLDGTDNRDPVLGIIVINPTLESVNEVKITTSNFDAEFGNALAAIITAQTKSGSNSIHGSVFDYRRSGATQARDPFTQYAADSITGRYIPASMWDQFGGSIGGPVLKNKLFYFGDFQGTRRKTGESFTESVPTQRVHDTCLDSTQDCDLSEYADFASNLPIYDPDSGNADGTNRTAFSGYKIPHGRLSKPALAMLKALPTPTVTGEVYNNYTTSGSGSFNDESFNTREDYNIREALHAFVRYSLANFHQDGAPVFGTMGGDGYGSGGFAGHGKSRDHSVAAGLDHAVNPKLMTDIRLGFFQYMVQENKWDAATTAAKDFGMAGLNTGAADTTGMPSIWNDDGSFSSLGDNINANTPLDEKEQQFQLVNNWTRIAGNHSIKFGADLRYATNRRSASDDNRTGNLDFNMETTADADNGGGLGLASFLLGDTYDFSRYVVASPKAGERQKRFFAYAQDVWRVTPRLTATIGLRWEDIFPETVSVKGMGGYVDLTDGYVHIAGRGNVPTNGGQENRLTNFSPRLGLTYQFNEKTVIRAGWGRSFDEGVYGTVFGTALTHNIPVIAEQSLSPDYSNGYIFNIATGPSAYVFPTQPSSGLMPMQNGVGYNALRPKKMRLPDVDAWNLALQRQLTPTLSLDIAYVGNKGQHVYPLNSSYNVNQVKLGSKSIPQNQRKAYYNKYNYSDGTTCCSQSLWSVDPTATSGYNSLQVRLDKRFANGFQVKSNYTWSSSFDHHNKYYAIDPSVMRGAVDYNRKQIYNVNGIYELPIGHGKKLLNTLPKWADYVVGGYQISSVTSWASGLPFTWTLHQCSDLDVGGQTCRPDHNGTFLYGNGKFDASSRRVQWFTPVASMPNNGDVAGAWKHPATLTFGNAGRNTGWGPRSFTSDMSLAKKFDIYKVKGEFNMDVYNVFNHPVLGLPSGCVDCTTGGRITSLQGDSEMRNLEFGLHFAY